MLIYIVLSVPKSYSISFRAKLPSKWERNPLRDGAAELKDEEANVRERQFKSNTEIQKWKRKTVWVDDERDEGRLQSKGVVQLQGTLKKIETETKGRS